MSPLPDLAASAAAPARPADPAVPRRRVTDAPTRMFHWLFALSFAGAYLTAETERWRALHVTLGYTVAGLLVFRVLYGLLGPRQASLGLLWRKLAGAPAAWQAVRSALAQRRLQALPWRALQNLLMALAVVSLLALALPLTLSGYGTYQEWAEVLEDVHEAVGEAMLAVVLAHIGLIAGLSLLRRKNQAAPMLSGHIDGPGPDLARHNHAWLAGLLLAAVLGFGAWQWQQAPNGLVPGAAAGGAAAVDRHGDEDD